jgi:uncharacterized protein YecE (DUF72 family)
MTHPIQESLFRPPERDASLRVGPAGWNYDDWEGIVYPAGKGRSFDALRFVADYFDTVEVNSSFYAPPRPQVAAAWAHRVRHNSRFKFTAKAWQRITHERQAAAAVSLAADCDTVRRSMAPLAEAGVLGAVLIQFPWSFRSTPENLDYLVRLFRMLPGFTLAVEIRHGSWSNEEFLSCLRDNGVAYCNIDQPVVGNSMKPTAHVTAKVGYFRLHGRNYQNWFKEDAGPAARYDYLYTKDEIRQLSQLIRAVRQQAEETYAITNNHFRGQALANAVDILEELDARPPAVPPSLAEAYPHLKRKDA